MPVLHSVSDPLGNVMYVGFLADMWMEPKRALSMYGKGNGLQLKGVPFHIPFHRDHRSLFKGVIIRSEATW